MQIRLPLQKTDEALGIFPFQLRPICRKHDPCDNVVDGRHPARAQREHHGVRRPLNELYSIPPQLCDDIAVLASLFTP